MGGVVTNTAKVEEKLFKILNITKEKFESICNQKDEFANENLMNLLSDGIIQHDEFWKIFSKRSSIQVKTDWWHLLFHPSKIKDTIKIIEKLKSDGHRVVCGTNTFSSYYLNHLERGDYSFFHQTYASNFMGVSKPNIEFWKIILLSEEYSPEETIFIDDKIENCKAAQSLGIKAIHFSSADALAKELNIKI